MFNNIDFFKGSIRHGDNIVIPDKSDPESCYIYNMHNAGFYSNVATTLDAVLHAGYSNFKNIKHIDWNLNNCFYGGCGVIEYLDLYKSIPDLSKFTKEDFKTRISSRQKTLYNTYFDFKHPIFDCLEPTEETLTVEKLLLNKYEIDPNTTLGVYYRGGDKFIETVLGDIDEWVSYIIENLKTYKKVLIQTDTLKIRDVFITKLDNFKDRIIIIEENPVSLIDTKTVFNSLRVNVKTRDYRREIFTFEATLRILSKCESLILSTSNCSMFTIFYRRNIFNVLQTDSTNGRLVKL